jgi:hypothetical protein
MGARLRIIDLDSCICTKVSKLSCSGLGSIIGDYIIGDVKLAHDLTDEFHSLGSCYRGCQLCFDPFGELVHHYKDVCESTFSFLEWTY